MPIPGFQEFMLPLLKLAADGQEHKATDAIDAVATQLGLSEQDQELMQRGSEQTTVCNRGMWAVTYLTKSLLLEKPARGRFKITPRGISALRKNPPRINVAFLMQFDEFRAFKTKKISSAGTVAGGGIQEVVEMELTVTPDEQLHSAYNELRETLADELLGRVRSVKPKRFEQLVVDVLVAMGYGGSEFDAAKVVGKSGDGGIDGVIKEDRLGLDMVYVQAKRYTADIGPGAIREFVGSLGEHKATKGVFITCSGFTSGAREAAAKAHFRIVLIDGEQLAEYMIDHGVGVTDHKTYTVKKLDSDYFDEA
jgi:restriction system protein